ncbi:hypothetical protein [Streptomyces tendae]|uniref:hypothetical protein n=1 Tax=Streptomyces tendae TaxID=1932 RepID=UPI003D73D7E1
MTDQTTDRHTCHNQKAAAGPAWQCPHCSATPPVPLPPVVQSPIREQLLNSIDWPYCQSLGYDTPEGLLAAYEASRTAAVDDSTIEALSDTLYDALYAITPFAEQHFADEHEGLRNAVRAVLDAVVLPTTNHDTDTSAELETARATNQRLNREKQQLESELATYRRAVAQWEINDRGTYIPHSSLRAIGLASGKDILGSVRHLKHFERVEQAEAANERLRAVLRRVADETAATETQARRGDQFEAWLKTQRDACFGHASSWAAVDGLLDQYRLHADTGTPLGEHVCEARVVGDCECLELPAAGARQDGAQQ